MNKLKQYFTAPAKAKTEDIFERAQIDLTFDLTASFLVLYIAMLIGTFNLKTSLEYDIVNYSSFVGIVLSIVILRTSASYKWSGFVFWLNGFITANAMVIMAAGVGISNLQFGVWHSFSIVLAFSLLGKKWGVLNAIYMIVITVLIALNEMNNWNLFDLGFDRGDDIDKDPVPVIIPMIATTYIMYQTLRVRNKAQKLISDQKDKEREQRLQIERKNSEIVDSISYAKRIQSAILPSEKLINKHLKNCFVLYKPKDIVAGDFYWLESSMSNSLEQEELVLLAAADCTGHGVPGAMVSVVCNNGLNRSVREFGLTKPGEILDKTRELVIQEFEKSEEEVNDGMDIALVALAQNEKQSENEDSHSSTSISLCYSGAHNPLWIIRKRNKEIEKIKEEFSAETANRISISEGSEHVLIEVKADKQPIGKFANSKPFTTHEIELIEGDMVYIFSDGYADQFGGENGKKLKSKNFKKLLLSIQNLGIEDQKEKLDSFIENWRGDHEQLDDICVIGMKIQ